MNGQRYLYIYDESKVDVKVKQGKFNMETFDIVRKVDTTKGNAITDVWEIDHLNSQSKEYLGYPTQKPLALLERIIKASTNEGDVVLDPFCGCGTALEAAALLGREFVGIDISLFSVETVVHDRLPGSGVLIDITGIPAEPAAASRLAKDDAFAFESWAIESCHPGMVGNKVQREDGGVDGTGMLLHSIKNGKNKIIAQVKASPPTIENIRAFAFNVQRKAVAGVFITLKKDHWTKGMQEIADSLGKFKYEEGANEYPRLQHWHVGQHFNKKYNRFPILPDLANPLTDKEITRKQLKIYCKQK